MFGLKKQKKEETISKQEFAQAYGNLERLLKENSMADVLHQLETRLKRQENMVEELLEQQDEQQEELQKIRGYLEEKRLEDLKQEQNLLAVIMQYEEYMVQNRACLEQIAQGETWQKQWDLLERSLKNCLEAGRLEKIQGEHQPVDLNRMEVLQVELVSDPQKENRVKQTVIPGWIYKGNVVQKAKVVAYRYKEECICQG